MFDEACWHIHLLFPSRPNISKFQSLLIRRLTILSYIKIRILRLQNCDEMFGLSCSTQDTHKYTLIHSFSLLHEFYLRQDLFYTQYTFIARECTCDTTVKYVGICSMTEKLRDRGGCIPISKGKPFSKQKMRTVRVRTTRVRTTMIQGSYAED